jgi:hypothetical protein
VAGYRLHDDGTINDEGRFGFYWSSTVNGTSSRILYFYSGNAYRGSDNRASGFSVRCLED